MLARLKQYFWIALPIAALYYLLSHHFIFTSWKDFDILKKKELTLEQTFYSLHQSSPEQTLRIGALREAGIADLMVAKGMISEEQLRQLLMKIDADQ